MRYEIEYNNKIEIIDNRSDAKKFCLEVSKVFANVRLYRRNKLTHIAKEVLFK